MRRSAITKCGPKSRLRATGVGEDQLLAEALHGGGFVVVHVENRHELGHLQHLFEFRAQIAKLERPALRSGAVKRRHQRSQSRTVDVRHIRHVQDDLLVVAREQTLDAFTERIAFLAQNDSPVQIHDGDPAYLTIRHSQCHVFRLLAKSSSDGIIPARR